MMISDITPNFPLPVVKTSFLDLDFKKYWWFLQDYLVKKTKTKRVFYKNINTYWLIPASNKTLWDDML